WSDLFRVDILNNIGLSIMLMGGLCWIVLATCGPERPGSGETPSRSAVSPGGTGKGARLYAKLALAAIAVATLISTLTPLLWTTWRPRFLPWQLETYINGVHNLGQPQPWLFPIFPWTAFAFAGLTFGFLLTGETVRKLGARWFLMMGAAGLGLIHLSKFFDSRTLQLYPVYDYWHTSPNFFLARVGFLLLFTLATYAWCRWGLGQWGFSPLIQLGTTSLLVYWVHIEFVYGRFSILPRQSQTIAGATRGLITIFLSMLALSLLRTKWKAGWGETAAWLRRSPVTGG